MDEKRKGPVRRLFGTLWSFLGWLRVSLANLVFLLVLLVLLAMLTLDRRPAVPDGGALVLDPSGAVVEQLSFVDPLAELLSGDENGQRETLLKDIVDAVRHAKDDERIAMIVLATDAMEGAGVTKIGDIAKALEAFRATGRKVIAVGDAFSQDQYLLAAQADEIWMHPMGTVELSGYASYRNYYAGTLEKLKIDLRVFRSGTFKSAFEFLERGDMSEADRMATGDLLREIWSAYTTMVTAQRKLPPESVDHYANTLDAIYEKHGGDAGAAALEYGFVDQLKSRIEMDQALKDIVGEDAEGNVNAMNFRDYLGAVRPVFALGETADKPAVGVIVASGMILDGERPSGSVGGDTLARLILQAADDDDIAALVLRIDSPGGSGFASEIIREALLAYRDSGKPLVASMGSVAASGGYWIAAPADEIWASPTTITGSIGVLSAFPSFSRGLAELGVGNDGVATTRTAGGLDPARPLSPAMAKVLELANHDAYRRFIGVVAEGRNMAPERVAEVAEGRAWSGAQAAQNGLVDHLGDLDGAIAAAARLATLEDYRTQWIEEPRSWAGALLERLSLSPQSLAATLLARGLGIDAAAEPLAPLLEGWRDPRAQYAICTVCAVY
jgi:protease-4